MQFVGKQTTQIHTASDAFPKVEHWTCQEREAFSRKSLPPAVRQWFHLYQLLPKRLQPRADVTGTMLQVESHQLRSKSQGRNQRTQRTGDAGGYKKAFAGKAYQPSTKTLKLSTVSQDLSNPPVELKCSECSFIITSHLPFPLERQVFNMFWFLCVCSCIFDVYLKQGPRDFCDFAFRFSKKVTIGFWFCKYKSPVSSKGNWYFQHPKTFAWSVLAPRDGHNQCQQSLKKRCSWQSLDGSHVMAGISSNLQFCQEHQRLLTQCAPCGGKKMCILATISRACLVQAFDTVSRYLLKS